MTNTTNLNFIKTAKQLQRHPFHLVDPSPWPVTAAIAAFSCALGGVMYMHAYNNGGYLLLSGFFIIIIYNVFMMTWCYKRSYFFRTSYRSCSKRITLWCTSIYSLWSIIFFLLSFELFFIAVLRRLLILDLCDHQKE